MNGDRIRVGDIEIRPSTHDVYRRGFPVALRPKEFDLLMALVRRDGSVAQRAEHVLAADPAPVPQVRQLVEHDELVRAGVDGSLLVDTVDVAAFRQVIAYDAREVGARLFEVSTLDDDLESVFRYLVGAS